VQSIAQTIRRVGGLRTDALRHDVTCGRRIKREWPFGASLDSWFAVQTIPIVILTTSDAESDITRSYQLHANCYLTKPVRLEEFENLVKSVNDFWLTKVKLTNVAGVTPLTAAELHFSTNASD
jgi:CheY-like chemotaxis protein